MIFFIIACVIVWIVIGCFCAAAYESIHCTLAKEIDEVRIPVTIFWPFVLFAHIVWGIAIIFNRLILTFKSLLGNLRTRHNR